MMGRLMRELGALAALGFLVLAAADAMLLLYAWQSFVLTEPRALEGEWPTFSRALTVGDAHIHALLAALGGAGLFVGALGVVCMRVQQRRYGLAACAVLAAALGVVHYFHVTITLTSNLSRHMALSYLFFFGMSGAILADLLVGHWLGLTQRAQRRCGAAVFFAAAAFLLTYVLKDVAANPWPVATQHVFVAMEWLWIIATHAYALLYMRIVRDYFRPLASLSASCAPVSALP